MTGTRLLIEAGDIRFHVEGSEKFVAQQAARHRLHIDAILKEQLAIIKRGGVAAAAPAKRSGRPGRPPGSKNKPKADGLRTGRRPGRRPQIIRTSDLKLNGANLADLKAAIAGYAAHGKLGKDATVFATAYYICEHIFGADRFSAGDVSAALEQAGKMRGAQAPASLDVVQLLRNLSAASVGKMWVGRNTDGTFHLTDRGRLAAAGGNLSRPRGRRAAAKKPSATAKRGPGRPRRISA